MGDNGTFDPNAIVADFLSRYAVDLTKSLYANAKISLKEFQVKIGVAFTRYLDDQLRLRSYVRTLLYRSDARFLYDFYVPQNVLRQDTQVIEHLDAPTLFSVEQHSIITGTGGSGKSILLRHVLIDCIKSSKYAPLFIELRRCNDDDETVESLIFRAMSLPSLGLTTNAIEQAMKDGRFAILLDGLDEVAPDKRDDVSRSIQSIRESFPKTPLVVTSRPDTRFTAWDGFGILQIQPLDLPKIHELIGRLDYPEEDKSRFLADIDARLFETHESFLSNPLLLTIMLITYSYNASVPNKSNLFYEQVFDALWNKHDATKDGYKRHFQTDLDRSEFVDVLSLLSFQSWWDSKVSFDTSTAHTYLKRCREVFHARFKDDDYLEDLTRSVCVLVMEGLLYTYSHRSFQEYYAAIYAIKADTELRQKILPKLAERASSDAVLQLAWEMQPAMIEDELLLPTLRRLRDSVERAKDDRDRLVEYLRFWVMSVIVSGGQEENGDRVFTPAKPGIGSLFDFLVREYAHSIPKNLTPNVDRRENGERLALLAKRFSPDGTSKTIAPEKFDDFKDELVELGSLVWVCSLEALDRLLVLLQKMELDCQSRHDTLADLFD